MSATCPQLSRADVSLAIIWSLKASALMGKSLSLPVWLSLCDNSGHAFPRCERHSALQLKDRSKGKGVSLSLPKAPTLYLNVSSSQLLSPSIISAQFMRFFFSLTL